jgi:di/tricarboxylate transporter
MNNLTAGALLLPSAMEAARRTGIKPSKLLIPVAYGSLLGGVATYFTTANIIVSNLLTSAIPPQAPLHILDFTATGGLIAIAGLAFLALMGKRLLPDRPPSPEQMMARRTSSELEDFYQLEDRLWEVRISPESSLAYHRLNQIGIGKELGLAVAAIWHGRQAIFPPPPDQMIMPGDILLIVGRGDRVEKLKEHGCIVGRESGNAHISARGVTFIEVMPGPHSHAIGQNLKDLGFRSQYGYTAVALWHGGRSYRTDVGNFKLTLGDSLLMIGPLERLKALQNNPDFIVLQPDLSDQPVQRGQAALTIGVIVTAIVLSIIGMPVYLAMLAGAVVVLLAGVLSMEEAYHAIEWQAIFLIAGMYSVSQAMVLTGLAGMIGDAMVTLVSPIGPLGLAAGSYLLTSGLTQVMGGQVTALVTGPIAISAALSLHTSPQAMAVATAIGCSASFFTPLAHPVNLLMIGPANYQFKDFFHIGWRLTLVCFVMLLIGMAFFWRL